MKIRAFITGFIMTVFSFCWGQKQGNIWFFGEGNGIDFNVSPPVFLAGGKLNSSELKENNIHESTASIADSLGNLLFYTDGLYVFNRNHKVMPNGSGLAAGVSATQAALIVPIPGSRFKYYIFTADDFLNNLANGNQYSIVDLCADNGLGDVVVKNQMLLGNGSEKQAMTTHSNGTDWWVIEHANASNSFYAYQITAEGISNPVISTIGPVLGEISSSESFGELKVSPDGKRIVMVIGNHTPATVSIFDFDTTTGRISTSRTLDLDADGGYGASFSPDSKHLYITDFFHLHQYRVEDNATLAGIISTEWKYDATTVAVLTGLQLATNGKIYGIEFDLASDTSHYSYVCAINQPDLDGEACDLQLHAITLLGPVSRYGFPTFSDNFNYPVQHPITGSAATLEPTYAICQGGYLVVDGTATFPRSRYQWSDGSTDAVDTIRVPGNYWLITTGGDCDVKASFTVTDNTLPEVGTELETCGPVTLIAAAESASYTWDDGTTSAQRRVTQSGVYWIDRIREGCHRRDTFKVTVDNPFMHELSGKVSPCKGELDTLRVVTNAQNVVWFNNTSALTSVVSSGGIYYVDLSTGVCHERDSITVRYVDIPDFYLPADTTVCAPAQLMVNSDIGSADGLWSTGSTSLSTDISASGIYWFRLSEGGCIRTDSTQVSVVHCALEMPNVFTPNGDELNERFVPIHHDGVVNFELKIINRWGMEIFRTKNIDGWDGGNSPAGIYYWRAAWQFQNGTESSGVGWVQLMR